MEPETEHNPEPVRGSRRVGSGLFVAQLLTVFAIAASNILLGFALIWSGIFWRRLRRPWRLMSEAQVPTLLRPLGLYLLLLVASVLVSYQVGLSADELGEALTLATLPLALLLVQGEREVRRLYDLLIATIVALALVGIGQYLFTDYGPINRRIPSLFSHYMTFSGVLLLGDCLVLARLATRDGWRKWPNWVALAILKGTLFLTLTRSAWIAAGLVLTIVLWLRARRFFVAYLGGLLLAGALTASVAPQHWARFKSIGDLENRSNYDRLCMAYAGLHMILERPLFGIGPGLIDDRYPIYRHPTAPRSHVAHLHNTFLNMAAERGLLALGAYLWLMVATYRLALREYRRSGGASGNNADLYFGIMLSVLALNTAGLFEANWQDTEIQRVMMVLMATPCCLLLGEPAGDSGDRPNPAATG